MPRRRSGRTATARRPLHHGRASPLPWLGALLLAYLLAPIVAFLVRISGQRLPAAGLGAAVAVSLETATAATAIVACVGVPLAYLLARRRGFVASAVVAIVLLPLALPPLVSGILLIYLVGPYAPIGRVFGGALTDSRIGIVLAQIFVAAPFLVIAARSAFTAVEEPLLDVAATLGHGGLARFWRVALPIAAPGIAAGLLLTWLRAFGEFGATVILAYHPYSLPVYTYVQFGSIGVPGTLSAVAASLAAAVVVVTLASVAGRVRLRRTRDRWPAMPLQSAPNERSTWPLRARDGQPATQLSSTREGLAGTQLRRTRDQASATQPRPAPVPSPGPALSFAVHARVGSFDLDVGYPGGARRLAILGASGAGKSLTLRALAGLTPSSGRVELNGRDVAPVAAEHRRIGYLPQDPALLPGRSAWSQAVFGVDADATVAAYWMRRLHLGSLAGRVPEQLSGGERRRVALVRALARTPDLLLLDEPFAGLDAPVHAELARELRRLQHESGATSVVVTHDLADAALLADWLLVLDAGRVLQSGWYDDVVAAPASAQVARLLGWRNVLPALVTGSGDFRVGDLVVCKRSMTGVTESATAVAEVDGEPAGSESAARQPAAGPPIGSGAEVRGWTSGSQVVVHLPPTAIRPRTGADFTIVDRIDRGPLAELSIAIGTGDPVVDDDPFSALVAVDVDPTTPWRIGDHCKLDVDGDHVTVWPRPGSNRDATPTHRPPR